MATTLQRPDGTIAYDDTGGPAPPLIAAPGMGDLRHVYRHIRSRLSDKGLRLVTMDLRGVGESSVAWRDYSDAAIGTDSWHWQLTSMQVPWCLLGTRSARHPP